MTKKHFIQLLIFAGFLWQCKPPSRSFRYEQEVQLPFFKKLETLLKGKIDSVKVYRATLEDVLVERDHVTEFKLMNTESKLPVVDFQVDNNFSHLYLMQLFMTPAIGKPCIFFSTGFSADSSCTHIGPAYMGFVNLNHINVKKELQIKQGGKYYIRKWNNKKLDILTDENFPAKEDQESIIRIQQILVLDPNKIGGKKPAIFPIAEIFKDPDALLFTYLETIKK